MKTKKVLIIGHFWPYRGGSARTLGLAKYLPDLGWEPIILTGPLGKKPDFNIRYIETDYRNFLGIKTREDLGDQLKKKMPTMLSPLLRFIFKRVREAFAYPDEHKYWKSFAIKEANQLLGKEKVEAIISVWPVTSHIIAKELKEKYKIPWIADFPDLWSQNYYYHYGSMRKLIDRKLELRTIRLADILTTISQPMADQLKSLHKDKEIYVITHGFDSEEVNEPPAKLTDKFTITYTGQIYTGKQDPLKILTALKELISERKINSDDIEVRFYGPERGWLNKEIKNRGLNTIVAQYSQVPRQVSLKKQWESQLLLLLNWGDIKEKGVYTGKIFEYLAARRPILATGGFRGDVVEKLLDETKAGVLGTNIEEIKNLLKNFYLEYKQKSKINYNGDWEKINKYNSREMARKFVEILNQIT